MHGQPALIRFKVIIGYGPSNRADSYDAQGFPFTAPYSCCIMGNGCLQEGISHKTRAYARHLDRGKVIAFGTVAASPSAAATSTT